MDLDRFDGVSLEAKPMARQQVTGNVGMYFAAYRLSQMGWNVMPTARNARGIDKDEARHPTKPSKIRDVNFTAHQP
jgi:hypothetical protein